MTGDRSDSKVAAAALLRDHGLRVTPQRRAIWAAFDQGRAGHLSADEVLRRARHELPELSRSTIYNALNEFVAARLLMTVESAGSQLYDPNVEDHHHFRCRSCGALYDVHPAGLEALTLDEQGFVVERAQIMFEGECSRCSG